MAAIDYEKLLVLVVEDEPYMRKLVVQMLNGIGVRNTLQAADGAEALQMLRVSRTPVDLILCDLRMPGMDGFQFVEEVRQKSEAPISKTPILVMSGNSDIGSVERAMKSGIDGFVVKPASQPVLKERLDAVLGGK